MSGSSTPASWMFVVEESRRLPLSGAGAATADWAGAAVLAAAEDGTLGTAPRRQDRRGGGAWRRA